MINTNYQIQSCSPKEGPGPAEVCCWGLGWARRGPGKEKKLFIFVLLEVTPCWQHKLRFLAVYTPPNVMICLLPQKL